MKNTCPAQLHKKGRNKFRARGLFENIPGQTSFFSGSASVATKLKASATFMNGSTWTSDFDVTAYKSKLEVETIAYENINAWLACKDGWMTLPSGRPICYVQSSKDGASRKEMCEQAGAYLMEIRTWDEAQTFLSIMFEFAKESTSAFALGAIAKKVGDNTIWVWDKSGDEIEVCSHGCFIKTSSDSVDITAVEGKSLYFDIANAPSSSDKYMSKLPYFDLHVRAAPETDATYFFCMKDGEGSTSSAATLTVSPVTNVNTAINAKAYDIGEVDFTLKMAHGTQTPLTLVVKPENQETWARICRIKISHVGRNFPCFADPTYGYRTSQNSTELKYSSNKRDWGDIAKFHVDMLSNWGKLSLYVTVLLFFAGSGEVDYDQNNDADSIRITAIVQAGVTPGVTGVSVFYQYIRSLIFDILTSEKTDWKLEMG